MNARLSPPVPRMLRTRAAAAYLGISEGTLRRLVAEGKIRVQFGEAIRSPWLFDIRELDKYIENKQLQLPKKRK